jgi:predicted RNA-binding Zn-ribbon protein involved in translation (DUF1610 family)
MRGGRDQQVFGDRGFTEMGPPGDDQTEAAVDTDSNLLRGGVGETCPECGRVIRDGQTVRRTVSGKYQHDAC